MTAKLAEKRSRQRIDIARPVLLENATGVTRDISASGVFFWISGKYSPGESISFAIELQRLVGGTMLRCRGDVVRTEPRSTDIGVAVRLSKTAMEAMPVAGRGMDALDPRSPAADRPLPRPQPRVTDSTWDDAAIEKFYDRMLGRGTDTPNPRSPAGEVGSPRPRWNSRMIVGTAVLAAIATLGYYSYRQRSPVDEPAPEPTPVAIAEMIKPAPTPARTAAGPAIPVQETPERVTAPAPEPAPVATAEMTKPAPTPARTAAGPAIPVQETPERVTAPAPEPAPVATAETAKLTPAPASVGGRKASLDVGQGRLQACPGSYNTAIWTNCVGEVTLLDGRKYVGEFRDGQYHGQGTETFPDGFNYIGEFRVGHYHGQGTATFPDGRKYVGEFRDSQYHGQGTATFPDGRKYVGEWRAHRPNGQGTETFPDGRKYVGEFRDGQYHGQGTATYPDGRKYVGKWRAYSPNGQGTEIGHDGSILRSGNWENGNFVEGK